MTVTQPVGRFKSRDIMMLAAACASLALPELAGETGRLTLRYDRAGLAAGQWWRLLTAHFVHLNLAHALLNILGLVLLWALFARDYSPGRWALIVLASMAAIDAGLWLGSPDLAWYVGASGVLHGVMAAGTWAHLRRSEFDGWILALFLIGKLAYEQFMGAMPFSAGLGSVVVDAHLYGALGGLAAALYNRPFWGRAPGAS